MEKFKRSAFLIVVGTAILLFMAGCGTKKHAAVMSGETLSQTTEALPPDKKVSQGDGIPLGSESLSQEDIGLGTSTTEATDIASVPSVSDFQPELPSQPGLPGSPKIGDLGEGEMVASLAPEQPSLKGQAEGSGEDMIRGISPGDFLPELPFPSNPFGGEKTTEASNLEEDLSAFQAGDPVTSSAGQELARLPGMAPRNGAKDGSDFSLSHIFFDFDQYSVREDAVPILEANAKALQSTFKDSEVLIEGHCDERGTAEYNLVLGERRAQAVKNYLADLGVSFSRINIVSYGKERPFCKEPTSACYKQNRTGHFVLQ